MILRQVARLLVLEPRERRLLLEAFAVLGAVAPILKFGPGALTGKLLQRAAGPTGGAADAKLVSDVAAAVGKAAPHVPNATCLARALAGWLMVTRRHEGATLRLGVNRNSAEGFAAHAWLECNGERVIGGDGAGEFTPFPPIP